MMIEQDCKIPLQVELLREGGERWRSERDFRWYPLLVAHVAKLWPPAAAAPLDAPIEEHLAAAARPHVQVRVTVALLAVLLVPLTWFLARRFLEPGWSLAAAAFVAFSLLHQSFSQQSRPHAVAATTFLVAVLVAMRMRRTGRAPDYVCALGALSLAIGTLQSGVACLVPLGVAHFARRRLLPWRSPKRLLGTLGLLAAVAGTLAATVLFFYPFHLFGAEVEGAAGGKQLGFDASTWTLFVGGHEIFLKKALVGAGIRPVAHALVSYEPVLLGLTLVAGVAWFATSARRSARPEGETFTRRRDAWVALSFALPYLAALLLYERTYERFLLPLLPYLAVAAAYAIREIAALASRRVGPLARPAGQAALTAAFLVVPVLGTSCLASIRAAPHTTTLAARWIERNLSRDETIGITSRIDVPLWRDAEGLSNWMGPMEDQFEWPWSRYQARLEGGQGPGPRWKLRWWPPKLQQMTNDPATYVSERPGRYVVAEVYSGNRTFAGATSVHDELRRSGKLLVRISPDVDPERSEHPLGYQEETSVETPHFLSRVLRARATGPVIEIHERPPR
jgi:hypothetical protein